MNQLLSKMKRVGVSETKVGIVRDLSIIGRISGKGRYKPCDITLIIPGRERGDLLATTENFVYGSSRH